MKFNPRPPSKLISLKFPFNIVIPSMPRSSKWSVSIQVSPPNPCMHLSSHLILDCMTWIMFREEHKLWSSSLRSLLHSCSFVPLRLKRLPQHPSLKHPQPSSYFNVRDQVLHPHKTRSKITFLYILNFLFLDRKTGRQKILEQMAAGIPWVLSVLNFLMIVTLMY